nr:substrate-binding domain-containing protein [Amycolatopsis coloradensis]
MEQLTTTRQPIEAMGRAGVELLVKRINGGEVAAEELLFAPELVVRGSTAPTCARRADAHSGTAGLFLTL